MEIFVKIHYSQFVLHLGSHACILFYDNIILCYTSNKLPNVINNKYLSEVVCYLYNNVESIDNIRIVCGTILSSRYTCIICIIMKCSVNTFCLITPCSSFTCLILHPFLYTSHFFLDKIHLTSQNLIPSPHCLVHISLI